MPFLKAKGIELLRRVGVRVKSCGESIACNYGDLVPAQASTCCILWPERCTISYHTLLTVMSILLYE
ncbi:hypothetical protein TNCV_2345411 [Trichonephila clavipes]|nr:hypothetical protein TNCV_2345411 [Trichonephila clavipes]